MADGPDADEHDAARTVRDMRERRTSAAARILAAVRTPALDVDDLLAELDALRGRRGTPSAP